MGEIHADERRTRTQWVADDLGAFGSTLRRLSMKKRTKLLLGGLTIAAGAVGAAGAYISKRKKMQAKEHRAVANPASVWARPGMSVTFRAELMPGRDREQRTFRVKELLPSGRVILSGAEGEHAEKEFEPI